MFFQDEALIYKEYDSLYYAITKKHGKILLKNYYFKNKYPFIKSFYFIIYEYNDYQLKKTDYKNSTALLAQDMELDYIVSLNSLSHSIVLFQYIFNYCIDYKFSLENIWNQLTCFFKQKNTQQQNNRFILKLFYELGILEINIQNETIEHNDIFYKNQIYSTLMRLNPNHKEYLHNIIYI